MNLASISLRNLRIRVVSTALTALSVALGAALLGGIWLMIEAAERHFKRGELGFSAIVGPKQGSALEIVLNTAFNRGVSPGLVPLSVYEELHAEKLLYRGKPLRLRYVIPQARGDNYKGYPIVGTTDEMFSKFKRGDAPLELAEGSAFRFGHEDLLAFAKTVAAAKVAHTATTPPNEIEVPASQRVAVVGAAIRKHLGLGLGAKFTPTHGMTDEEGAHVHEESRSEVIGVLQETDSAIDETIFVPLSTFLAISEHEGIKGESTDAGAVGLSAIIVNPADRGIGPSYLRDAFQMRLDAQVAFTGFEVRRLLSFVGNAADVLRVVSYFVLLVAALAILVALYNTMNERRREIAIMRALGARKSQIVQILVQEAVLVSVVGALAGLALCHLGLFAASGLIERLAHMRVDAGHFSLSELWLILGVAVLGGIAGVLPALKGSKTQVAENLGPTS